MRPDIGATFEIETGKITSKTQQHIHTAAQGVNLAAFFH